MLTEERQKLAAPCGIDCGICELYICKDDPQLYNLMVEKGISKDKIPCKGCRPIEGNCPVIGTVCATYLCIKSKNLEFCYECNDFPCDKLMPCADRANILPHNFKVYNLCKIKNKGIESFIKLSPEIKKRYYKGIMEVGNGPQLK